MSLISHSFFRLSMFCLLILPVAAQTPSGQPASPDPALGLRAALVLTPEFCATTIKQGDKMWTGVEKFEVGTSACAELEPALQGVFRQLNRVAAPPEAGTGEVVLVPRLVSASATRPTGITIFNKPKKDLLVVVEWTVKDSAGKTAWFQTVQGTATAKGRANGTISKKDMKILVDAAVEDAAKQSAAKMLSAPELRKLAEDAVPPKP
jgi:hypothetical protein